MKRVFSFTWYVLRGYVSLVSAFLCLAGVFLFLPFVAECADNINALWLPIVYLLAGLFWAVYLIIYTAKWLLKTLTPIEFYIVLIPLIVFVMTLKANQEWGWSYWVIPIIAISMIALGSLLKLLVMLTRRSNT